MPFSQRLHLISLLPPACFPSPRPKYLLFELPRLLSLAPASPASVCSHSHHPDMNCIILAASLLFLAANVNYVLVRNNHAEYSDARPETNGGLLALRSVAENSRKYTPTGNDPQLSLITIKRRRRKFTSLSVLSGPISTKNIVTIVLMCCGDIECPEIKGSRDSRAQCVSAASSVEAEH